MLFSWLRKRRRASILAAPFPAEWLDHLKSNVSLYALLTDKEQQKLQGDLRIFAAEKTWEGCGGLTITDEIKVTIAAQACLLLVGVEHDYLDCVQTILVYPSGYRSPEGWVGPDGVVREDTGRLGEAWHGGPVILAWDAVLLGGRDPRDGRNVVLHEFAHQLDFLDGMADGTPPLRDRAQYQAWHKVMTAEYARLVKESKHGKPKVLDAYGATDRAEFFAVATEAFFEKPLQMRQHHPALYELLSEYYCQDPAARFAGQAESADPGTIAPKPKKRRWPSRPYRRGRSPSPEALAKEMSEWPAWVQFWDLHPGRPRSHALHYLDQHVITIVGMLVALPLFWLIDRPWHAGHVILLTLLAGLTCTAVWLLLAVRWVDRHGRWAGTSRKDKGPQGEQAIAAAEDE